MKKFNLDPSALDIIENARSVIIPKTREELVTMSLGGNGMDFYEVGYEVNGKMITEATVVRCKNGVAVNYIDDYMRRRDPECMIIGDEKETDKPRFADMFEGKFEAIRQETFKWLKKQDLILMPFMSGGKEHGYPSILIAPRNAAFFATALADLQHFVDIDDWKGDFTPRAVIYLAPPFRHTHFGEKQIVVHNRLEHLHELFSYNLYPGPSAKKGIYGVLLTIGEEEGWVTAHASTVKVITPYENEIVIMHEGASGAGKSEMIEQIHRESDGRIVIGKNTETKEKFYLILNETCELQPVTDDMALCHPDIQNDSRKLVVQDAEEGWFIRLDTIKEYGIEPTYEKICTQPSQPLLFMNIQAVPKATCLIWEHTLDSDGTPCPNPRVILPRKMIPNVVDEPVEVDVRSFGIRAPLSTAEHPNYGVLGMLQIIPPALAWLWRLVAPRGDKNPSIIDSGIMVSEGVGSYWPFATGRMVNQANLLLDQILASPSTRYVLIPNQHIGAYKVSFMPQWISREYIARRGSAKFKQEHLVESRCPLLGYGLESMKVDGQYIRKAFLQPETQSELGVEGYDAGAKMLVDFFKKEIVKFNTPELNPLGQQIIEACLRDATLQEYIDLIPMRY
jgi:hypothetical protein